MKIALCLSGQPRLYKEGFPSFKKYIDQYDMDVFIHCWFSEDEINKQYSNVSITVTSDSRKVTVEPNTINDLETLYKPKGFIHEKQYDCNEFIKSNYRVEGTSPFASLSKYFSLYKSNELKCQYEKEHNIKYDYVIWARTDTLINHLEFPEQSENVCYFSDLHDNTAVDDLLFYSSNDISQLIADSYKEFDGVYNNSNLNWVNERLLYKYLLDNKVNMFKSQYIKAEIIKIRF